MTPFMLWCVLLFGTPSRDASSPAAPARTSAWRNDPAWYDGQAEKCTYRATREIYGAAREYVAIAYTDKELADPRTTTKSEDDTGLEVFKHHWSERVPTERYDYDFSTMCYLRADDLSAFKLTAATQEDCGASFKEVWRDRERLRWAESVYFPGTGRREGSLSHSEKGVGFEDALSLSLRDYDFEARPTLALRLIPSQKDTHRVPFEPEERRVRYVGSSALTLPIGTLEAHELALETSSGEPIARYWFAADATAPRLHALVRYEGPHGVRYELESLERTAYWKH
jgi:hypothetical protein